MKKRFWCLPSSPPLQREIPIGRPNRGPSRRVYALIPARWWEGQKLWLNIGSAFEHKDGKGYNLVSKRCPSMVDTVLRDVQDREPEPEAWARIGLVGAKL